MTEMKLSQEESNFKAFQNLDFIEVGATGWMPTVRKGRGNHA